ncbi:hypothetical protein A500_10580 [Clostridium sartagoforme AAU1]|uniref:Uncharacterized protein n=1 Tax=Clostridium sartagoforme AAU1 TaxID=1202534 RepID=R9CDM5_9CLOT|nr:hypothetical protein [Clostridium sartagoforme]EOR25316.1 hypothetical protein A500_10580 [Clostridium sartagoforme AAU1]
MDHAINSLQPFYEVTLDQFIEEHRSDKYKKFSENPYYTEVKALIDAMNILRKYLGWETIKLKDEVEFYLQGGE